MQPLWWLTKDGDRACLALYERHYSAYRYRDGRVRKLFVGPGEKVVLRLWDGGAFFVWRAFIDDSGQDGINCAAFRNESMHQSSELVRQADAIADLLWPDRRHYTYVDPRGVRSTNPGYCFLRAGWKRCGHTKGGLVILERNAPVCPHIRTSQEGTAYCALAESSALDLPALRREAAAQAWDAAADYADGFDEPMAREFRARAQALREGTVTHE